MSADDVAMVQAITGLDNSAALALVMGANGNVELAIARHFDGPQVQAPPPVQAHHQPPPKPDDIEDDISIDPEVFVSDKKTGSIVPLLGMKVSARVNQMVAEVNLGLRFVNSHATNPIEAVLKISDEGMMVHDFEVNVGDTIIKGECMEKQEAFAKYDDAISSGHSAFLAEKKIKRNTFDVYAGNLPPGMSCVINVRYLTCLETVGENFVFGLPLTRTIPPKSPIDIKSFTDQQKQYYDDLRAQVPDGISMVVVVNQNQRIVDVSCSTHATQIEKFDSSANLTLEQNEVTPQRFEMTITLADPHQPSCVVEKCEEGAGSLSASSKNNNPMDISSSANQMMDIDPVSGAIRPQYKKYAMSVSMIPQLSAIDADVHAELIFIVDCSGSMAGSRMTRAKNALQLFLRALPESSKFNIIAFGDKFQKMFQESKHYNSETLGLATAFVTSLDSRMGGTDLLGPVSEVLKESVEPGYPRQVFLLTDGDVKEKEVVLNYIRANIGDSTRIFVFGIGNSVSEALLKGMAKFGRGKAEFVAASSNMEAPVMRQVSRALQPVMNNVVIDWGDSLRAHPGRVVDYNFPPIFNGERFDFYSFFEAPVDSASGMFLQNGRYEIKIKATAEGIPVEFPCLIDLNNADSELSIQRLAAHYEIRDMEMSPNHAGFKQRIVALATKYHLASKYTSFVAVEANTKAASGHLVSMDVDEAIAENKAEESLLGSLGSRVNDLLHRSGQFLQGLAASQAPTGTVVASTSPRDSRSTASKRRQALFGALDEISAGSESDDDGLIDSVTNFDKMPEDQAVYSSNKRSLARESSKPQTTAYTAAPIANAGPPLPRAPVRSAPPPSLASIAPMAPPPPPPSGEGAYGSFEPASMLLENNASVFGGRGGGSAMVSMMKKSIVFKDQAFSEPAMKKRKQEKGKGRKEAQNGDEEDEEVKEKEMKFDVNIPSGGDMRSQQSRNSSLSQFAAAGPALAKLKPTSPVATAKASSALDFIVHAQANGQFDFNPSIFVLLGVDEVEITKNMPTTLNDAPELWATALVLAALTLRFSNTKDEWQLVYNKAKKFLAKALVSKSMDLTAENLIDMATAAL